MNVILGVIRSLIARASAEKGQILILAAGGLTAMLGFGALAIDYGFYAHAKRDVQNDADAMALAGVQRLRGAVSDQTLADTTARSWAVKNNVANSEILSIQFNTTCSNGAGQDTITVRLRRTQNNFLARIFGINSGTLSSCATARVGVGIGGVELLPFSFLQTDPYPGANPDDVCYFNEINGSENANLWNDQCLIKIPALSDAWASGNSGPLRFDEGSGTDPTCSPGSSGASEYEENIIDGSECMYSITSPGNLVPPKTGNMKGPTCDAFGERLAGNNDALAQVFSNYNAATGVYETVNRTSPRFGLVPITTAQGSGSSAVVTITGFMTVYINSACGGPGCNGAGQSPACVIVTPVKSRVFMEGVAFAGGSLTDNTNALRTIKLVD